MVGSMAGWLTECLLKSHSNYDLQSTKIGLATGTATSMYIWWNCKLMSRRLSLQGFTSVIKAVVWLTSFNTGNHSWTPCQSIINNTAATKAAFIPYYIAFNSPGIQTKY